MAEQRSLLLTIGSHKAANGNIIPLVSQIHNTQVRDAFQKGARMAIEEDLDNCQYATAQEVAEFWDQGFLYASLRK